MRLTVVCPYCYQRIKPSRLGYQCTGRGAPGRPRCAQTVDRARLELTGYSTPAYPSFTADRITGSARRAQCPACFGQTGVRVCPTCHTPLSIEFAESRSPLIGMVGGKGAGKTVYLAVLHHELRNAVRRRFGADIRLAGDHQPVAGGVASPRAWVENYEKSLFDDGELPEGTATATDGRRTPLVIEWRQERRVLAMRRFSTTVLSFYDAAGEDFVTQSATHAQAYLNVADGMIVLLDPWQLPGLAHVLDVPDEVVKSAEQPIDVLKRITGLLRAAHGVGARKLVTTPLAVVFAKMDALFPVLDDDSPLMRTPPARAGYDESAGLDTHEHVRELLDRFGADDIDAHLRLNYRHFRYFSVSALGSPPNYATKEVDRRGIRPLRVDEPLLWLLSRLGVVDRITT